VLRKTRRIFSLMRAPPTALKGGGSSLTLRTYNYNMYILNAGAKRHLDVWRGSDLR
jgi:hypothetical protein